MKKLVIGIAIFLIPNLTQAQVGTWGWTINNYYKGNDRNEEIDHETANKMRIENRANRVRTKWSIQDEARARRLERQAYNHWLERKKRMFEVWEKRAEVEAKEKELIKKGILPPKKSGPKGISFNGRLYENFEELRQSPDFQAGVWKQRIDRELKEENARQKRQDAVSFERERRQYSASTIFWRDQRNAEKRLAEKAISNSKPSVKRYLYIDSTRQR